MPPSTGAWAATTPAERTAWLRAARRALASRLGQFADLISRDVHKPRWEALTGDLLTLLISMRWHEKHAPRILAPRRVPGAGVFSLGLRAREVRAPLGRVAIIATWNYPVQLLGVQLVQALIAGNDVVVKPSENAPRSQRALLELFAQGLPPHTLTWTDAARDAGPALLNSQRFDHIVFTGSTRVGRAVAAVAADRLTPTTLELSGCDSALVLDDADPALAASSIWTAFAMNAGQTCMAPRRALVDRAVMPRFLAALAPLAAAAPPRTLISHDAAREAFDLARGAVLAGGRSLTGVLEPPQGSTLRPIVIADCPPRAPLVAGEHFGPVLAVIPVAGPAEMLDLHRTCAKHLATSVFTARPGRAAELAPRLNAGIVTINDALIPAGQPGLGVVGSGESGWGVSRGAAGLLAMTRPLYITTTSTRLRMPASAGDEPSPGMTERMTATLRWMFGGSKSPALARTPDQPTSDQPMTESDTAPAHESITSHAPAPPAPPAPTAAHRPPQGQHARP
ncbi:MAG: aldehyde dehydrogenase family protein [Planctomycetota bacterium]|nr:aldehyde dehydrogenase family protein [Planctomycetota bacterium]